MKARLLVIALLLPIATAMITAGCRGGGSPQTLEEYFAEFEAIDAEVFAQVEPLFDELPGEDEELTDADLPLIKNLVAELPRIFGGAVDRLSDLDPPSDVETTHRDLLVAGEELVRELEEDREAIANVESFAEAEALEDQLTFLWGPAAGRFDDACFELLSVAEASGISVNAECGGD